MRKQVTYILFYFVFSLNSNAQNIAMHVAPASDMFKHIAPLSFSHNLSLIQTQPAQGSILLQQAVKLPEIKSGSIHDMPFFCAMECRLRGRTGLWIKLRTGDDASYEKLIHSAGK